MPTAKLRQNIPSKQYPRQVALLQGLVTRSENLLGFDEIIVSFAEIHLEVRCRLLANQKVLTQ